MASRSWNRVELIGNLTRDPELRYTPNGAAVCTFSVATNRTYVSEGEKKEEVDFHRLVSWNKLAELCNQLLKKGNRVFVSGRLQTRSWEGNDGQNRQTTEIVLEDMILLTPRAAGEFAADEIPTRTIETASIPIASGQVESGQEEKPQIETQPKADEPPAEKTEEPKEEKKKVSSEPQPQEEVEDLPF